MNSNTQFNVDLFVFNANQWYAKQVVIFNLHTSDRLTN